MHALDNFAHSHIVARDADQDQQHTQQRKLCTDFTHGALFKSKLEASFVIDSLQAFSAVCLEVFPLGNGGYFFERFIF